MELGLFRVHDRARTPEYATGGSVAFDISTVEPTEVQPGATVLARTGWVFAVPPGSCLVVSLRSSTPRRYGVIQPHGIGLIDQDYRGPDDEVKIPLLNIGDSAVTIPDGTRIAQGLLVPIAQARWTNHVPPAANRGGFGSTNR